MLKFRRSALSTVCLLRSAYHSAYIRTNTYTEYNNYYKIIMPQGITMQLCVHIRMHFGRVISPLHIRNLKIILYYVIDSKEKENRLTSKEET